MTPARIREAFVTQAAHCAALGSPFMERLCGLLAVRDWPKGEIRDRIFDWRGDPSNRAGAVPLRLAGALHALKLAGDPVLTPAYPPYHVSDDALWDAVCASLVGQATFIDDFIDSPPQTNEVRRAAAIIAAAHYLHALHPLPLRVSELGASGGLNLMFDRFALALPEAILGPLDPALTLTPDWSGALPPLDAPQVVARAGVDLRPVDPHTGAGSARLQAYLWADQPDRLTLTQAAIAAAGPAPAQADAIDWLAPRLTHVPGQTHLIYHTIAWQYFPTPVQDRGRALIAAAGALATQQNPLAWVAMEADTNAGGAALTLRLWPGDLTITLGRVDFHGRWIDWTAPVPVLP
ncbi:DUF2332 family protein [Loktanella sp. TSTF-M6]|uniref:DUF2332 family protein n=1 Tax=Loktanella gaetbuli TaxID=2881335 RepID=A0ABS8BV83_9RHOB|nr:DUF2332 family protein [Loktanella gaetbuli]MCB5199499.1 DUF2332 family protein [Loktanella gaetbuli]